MFSPFSIEEIFPDVSSTSVRLPRRQSGGSPQSLAVTLLADYTLHTRAWLPSAAIVTLLGEAGVNPAGARAAISRLARRGVLENRRRGRLSDYRLTRAAADSLLVGGRMIAAFGAGAAPWDGWWTLVAFSLPQEADADRRALRGTLRWWGYAPLYDGLWVSPHPLGEAMQAELLTLANGAMTVFRARHVEVEAVAGRAPIEAFDTAGLARRYESFIRRWRALVPRVRANAVTGAAAVRARTEIMDTYRRFPTLDPWLPVELMPNGRPRQDAREVFLAVYDGLAEPAQEHVRTVVARHAAGSEPDVRAHTMAEFTPAALPPGRDDACPSGASTSVASAP